MRGTVYMCVHLFSVVDGERVGWVYGSSTESLKERELSLRSNDEGREFSVPWWERLSASVTW